MANSNPVINPTSFFKTTLAGTAAGDFHRIYLFKVSLPKLGVSSTQETELITYFVSATVTPVETTNNINVDWMNSQIKIAGRTTYGDWTVTVRDDSGNKAFDYFKAWRKLVYDNSTGQSDLPVNYKFDFDLLLLDNRGESDRDFTIKGGFPREIGQVTFDYATEAIVTFPVTIHYDDFIPK